MDLVPIKVNIRSHAKGCKYPDFNQLDAVKASGMDWSNYIDVNGSGWLYDNKCGHAEVDAESPEGIWYGLLLIPEAFATQAIAMFPEDVVQLTEAGCEIFYDERHACKMSDEDINTDILQGLQSKKDLGLTLTEEQQKALDPNDDTPGITKNKKKRWVDFKVLKGVTIV